MLLAVAEVNTAAELRIVVTNLFVVASEPLVIALVVSDYANFHGGLFAFATMSYVASVDLDARHNMLYASRCGTSYATHSDGEDGSRRKTLSLTRRAQTV